MRIHVVVGCFVVAALCSLALGYANHKLRHMNQELVERLNTNTALLGENTALLNECSGALLASTGLRHR